MKRFLIAVTGSALAMFSLAGLYTGVLARQFITTHVNPDVLRTSPNFFLIFLGYLVLAILMSLIYPRVIFKANSPALSGLRFGIIAAVCWLVPYSLVLFGAYNFPYLALPLDIGWALIEQSVGGVIIGLSYGKLNTKPV